MPKHICGGWGEKIEGKVALRYMLDSVYFHPRAEKIAEFAEKHERMAKLKERQPIPQDCLEQDVKGDCVMAYMFKGHAIAYNDKNFETVRL